MILTRSVRSVASRFSVVAIGDTSVVVRFSIAFGITIVAFGVAVVASVVTAVAFDVAVVALVVTAVAFRHRGLVMTKTLVFTTVDALTSLGVGISIVSAFARSTALVLFVSGLIAALITVGGR